MRTILKVFLKFVTILLLFLQFLFFGRPLDQGSNLHPCIKRQCLNHWSAREVPSCVSLNSSSASPSSGVLLGVCSFIRATNICPVLPPGQEWFLEWEHQWEKQTLLPSGLPCQHLFEFSPICQLPASKLPPTSYPQNLFAMMFSELEFQTNMPLPELAGLGFHLLGQESGPALAAACLLPLLPWGARWNQKIRTQASLFQCDFGVRSHTDQDTASSSL